MKPTLVTTEREKSAVVFNTIAQENKEPDLAEIEQIVKEKMVSITLYSTSFLINENYF